MGTPCEGQEPTLPRSSLRSSWSASEVDILPNPALYPVKIERPLADYQGPEEQVPTLGRSHALFPISEYRDAKTERRSVPERLVVQ
jgi:hypothetical protein